jgi:hypothetical protein
MSSASIRSSSEVLSDDSEQSIFTLPSELEIVVRSPGGLNAHWDAPDASDVNWPLLRLPGIFIALPDIVGDESGDDCSARVE